jgi:two-component system sensor histidine kinase UhpB
MSVFRQAITSAFLSFCIFLLFINECKAQTQQLLDSASKYRSSAPDQALIFAQRALSVSSDKKAEGKCLLTMGILYSDLSKYDSALLCLDKSMKIFQLENDSAQLGEVYENTGVAYEYQSEYQKALDNYQTAFAIRKNLKLIKEQAYSLNSIGNIHVFLNNYPKALELFLEVLRLGQEVGDEQVITNGYNNIGMVYDYNNDLDKALDYYQKARKGFEKLKNDSGLGGALNNIGLVYKNKGEPQNAIPVYKEALAIYTKLKSRFGIAVLENNLGVAFELTGNLEEALNYHHQALEMNTQIGNADGISNSNNSIGQCYLKLKQFAKANEFFSKGLETAKHIKAKDRMAESYEGMSKSWENLKDYKRSLDFYREAKILRDSILTAEKFQKLYDMEQKYESALKEKQIALLNAESEKQKLAIVQQQNLISKKNIQLTLIISFTILIALVVYLFYSRITLIQKAKVQALQNEKEQAVLKSVYEQRISISKDMHDEIGSGLTHIAMLSDLISSQQPPTQDVRKEVETISDVSRRLIQSMSEIIWALNPQNETLDNLVAYIREQTNEYFEPFNVEYKMNVPSNIPSIKLTNIQRRNLFLVTKETLNNALKHSKASVINFNLLYQNGALKFTVNDNGKGFDFEKIRRSANGLKNMKSRIEDLNGSFEIASSAGGTVVTYAIPLQQI